MTCKHENLKIDVNVNRFGDTNVVQVDLTVVCETCDEAFRSIGMPVGASFSRPATDVDGTEVRIPLCPVSEKPDSTFEALIRLGRRDRRRQRSLAKKGLQ